jgi:hypothetical protein
LRGSSEAGAAHPALPAVVLLLCFAFFMAAIAPLDFTSIFHKFFPVAVQKVPHKDAVVWADSTAGVYYCANSILFGKTKGEYMTQVNALGNGYQPALGTYCKGPRWSLPPEPRPQAAPPAPTPAVTNQVTPSAGPTPPPSGSPAAASTFENPNYKPQSRNTPPVGSVPTGPYIPH